MSEYTGLEIAVIGISCKVPTAENHSIFWDQLKKGFEPMDELSIDEIVASGVPRELAENKEYVRKSRRLKSKKNFDYSFFGYNKNEAQLLSPQTRMLHQSIWEAVEDSGSDIKKLENSSLFVSIIEDFTWQMHVRSLRDKLPIDFYSFNFLSAHHFTPALLSYKFGFTGLPLPIMSACSSSLVAIHEGCKSLLLGESKYSIVAGVNFFNSKEKGYLYKEGVESKDGHCRAFDADSSGTSWGEGVGVVVLKKLKDAIKDKDHIYSIIKGSACNNDSNRRIGYAAPSVIGQKECIEKALKFSRVSPETISYVETHGTGTALGDPVEVEALTQAYGLGTENKIPIGSLKSNIGHTSYAAGILSFIKAVLCVENKQIPPSINYESPNPNINFLQSPFYVNNKIIDIEKKSSPLRVAVTSLGIGGTNAHIILEEAPVTEKNRIENSFSDVFSIAAKSEKALKKIALNVSEFIENENVNIHDLAYTYRKSRANFDLRKSFIFDSREDLIVKLRDFYKGNSRIQVISPDNKPFVFAFSGQGSSYNEMGVQLYHNSEVFRNTMDLCFLALEKISDINYRKIFLDDEETDQKKLDHTNPIIFAFQYSYAQILIETGLKPSYMIGHSLGEYVCACLSGVISYEEALNIIYNRAKLLVGLPEGRMISIRIPSLQLEELLKERENVFISAYNSQDSYTISGLKNDMILFEEKLKELDIYFTELQAGGPYHTPFTRMIKEQFKLLLDSYTFKTPQIPFTSCATGNMVNENSVIESEYWLDHMAMPVLFDQCINTILPNKDNLTIVNIGPGTTVSKILKNVDVGIQTYDAFNKEESEYNQLLNVIVSLQEKGYEINWEKILPEANIISAPTYPFEKVEFIDEIITNPVFQKEEVREPEKEYYTYREKWEAEAVDISENKTNTEEGQIIVISDDSNIYEKLSFFGKKAIYICNQEKNSCSAELSDNILCADFSDEKETSALFSDLNQKGIVPRTVYFVWFGDKETEEGLSYGYRSIYHFVRGFDSVFFDKDLNIILIGDLFFKVKPGEKTSAIKATAYNALKMVNVEFDNITATCADIPEFNNLSQDILSHIKKNGKAHFEYAVREKEILIKRFEEIELPSDAFQVSSPNTYVITGGLRGLGFEVAKYIAENAQANLIIIGRGEENAENRKILEDYGTKVMYLQADLSDYDLLKEKIEAAQQEIGAVTGVIHAAGVGDYNGIILRRGTDDSSVFNPKIYGTKNLVEIFRNNSLQFFLGYSSRAVSKPFIGQLGYIAANSYLDNCISNNNGVTVHWPIVAGVGMINEALKNVPEYRHKSILSRSITVSQMLQILFKSIVSGEHLIIASRSRMDVETGYLEVTEEEDLDHVTFSKERVFTNKEYIAPETETEIKLVNIIKEVLCLDEVGIKDNMFELGGDSLKAMVILNKIKSEFSLEYSLKNLMDATDLYQISEEIQTITDNKITLTF